MDKQELVNEELTYLEDKILNEEITERIAGQEVTLGPDQPAQAAFYATWRTEIYDHEPVAILDYTKNIPGEWREYVTENRDEVQAMAKASFEHELAAYLENYSDEARY